MVTINILKRLLKSLEELFQGAILSIKSDLKNYVDGSALKLVTKNVKRFYLDILYKFNTYHCIILENFFTDSHIDTSRCLTILMFCSSFLHRY